jgi:hypothetical protein
MICLQWKCNYYVIIIVSTEDLKEINVMIYISMKLNNYIQFKNKI